MAVIYEDFIRCQECGSADFKAEEQYTFHKSIKEREDKTKPLLELSTLIIYRCVKCGHPLDR